MFVMRVLAPSVNRLIVVHDPGCSPVGNSVPWYVVPERLWEFAPSAEAGPVWLPRSPTENKSCDYGRSSRPHRAGKHRKVKSSVAQGQGAWWVAAPKVVLDQALLEHLCCIARWVARSLLRRLRHRQRSGFYKIPFFICFTALRRWRYVACCGICATAKEVVFHLACQVLAGAGIG